MHTKLHCCGITPSESAYENFSPLIVHRKDILLSTTITSPHSLRGGEVVSFTVEEGRKGVEAVNLARLDGGRVLGSLHSRGRRTTDTRASTTTSSEDMELVDEGEYRKRKRRTDS